MFSGLGTLIAVYWQQLRQHPWRLLLSIAGIVAGVAMIFAVQVSSQSVSNSFRELKKGVAGRAQFELVSQKPSGGAERVYSKIAALSGVQSAPILNLRTTLAANGKNKTVALVGVDQRLKRLGGKLVQGANFRELTSGIHLPSSVAASLDVGVGDSIKVEARASSTTVRVAEVLDGARIGTLSHGYFAGVPLPIAQWLAGVGPRVNQIFIASNGAMDPAVLRRRVLSAAGPGWVFQSTTAEADILAEASRPDQQSLTLFGAVSLMVGLLLAFNAMLVAAVERRRDFAQIRMIGANDSVLIVGLIIEALIIGVVGASLGILLGYWISTFFAAAPPRYLVAAFDLGNQHVVTAKVVLISFFGGVLAALLAATLPAVNLLRVRGTFTLRKEAATTVKHERGTPHIATLFIGLALLVATTLVLIDRPKLGILGIVTFALGGALLFPHIVPGAIRLIQAGIDRWGSAIGSLSLAELAATPRRTTALASISAFAVFAVVTVAGTTANLERGLRQLMADFSAPADLWISQPGEDNDYVVRQFEQELVGKVGSLPEIAAARPYRAAFLDWGKRKIWVGGPPANSTHPVAPSQIVDGNSDQLKRRLQRGGWAAMTWTLANDRDIGIGQLFTLPTPTGPHRYRLAAKITSHGWPGGAVMMSSTDLRRAWNMKQVTAIEADLASGVSVDRGKRAVGAALGGGSPLMVQPAHERQVQLTNSSRENLTRLYQIANIILAAALIAVITAMLTALAQRGPRVAALRALGMSSAQAFRALFVEIGVVLVLGAVVGLGLGLPLQYLFGNWLKATTGYPVLFSLEPALLERIFIGAVAVALLGSLVAVRELMRVVSGRALSPE